MPELPEVQTVLSGVVKELRGARIIGLECLYPGTVIMDPELKGKAWPATLTDFERRGKYMLLHLSGGHSLIIHLRMTGKLVSDRIVAGPSCHERACILLDKGRKLRFIDIRTFGKITLCRTENVSRFLPTLGVEPLGEGLTGEILKELFRPRKIPVKNALMDQSLIAGLGNIYANEILYRSKINPVTPANKISLPRLRILVKETKAVLTEAIAMNGTSISDFRRVDDKSGEFQNFLQIYQKELCPKGHAVKKLRQGGRSTFFCPVCQK